MKLVSGLRRPSTGSVVVDGAEVTRPLKTVGMAFQNPMLLPWRSSLGARKSDILLKVGLPRAMPYFWATRGVDGGGYATGG